MEQGPTTNSARLLSRPWMMSRMAWRVFSTSAAALSLSGKVCLSWRGGINGVASKTFEFSIGAGIGPFLSKHNKKTLSGLRADKGLTLNAVLFRLRASL